jgi:hypothetical protein
MSFFRPSSMLPRLKPLSSKRTSIVTVLDIGSSKVVCMIGRLTPVDVTEVLPAVPTRLKSSVSVIKNPAASRPA